MSQAVGAVTADLVDGLRRAGLSEVDDSSRRRAEYSTDASNYRVVPAAVAFPRHTDEVVAAAAVAREAGVPLTVRGAGTSVAGNAVGTGPRARPQPAPEPGARDRRRRRARRACSRGR